MINIKKFSLFAFSLLMVLTSLFFVACGKDDFSNVSLSVSNSAVELQVDESVDLTFTINNMPENMSNELVFEFSPAGIAKVEIISSSVDQINVRVSGVEAGSTVMAVKTKEGLKTCNVSIFVTEYSYFLEANENNLYVSTSDDLTIKDSDFVFGDKVNEKHLDFYFYGFNAEGNDLTLDDVSSVNSNSQRNFFNKFVSIKLINQNEKSYLIFSDEEGNEYSLSQGQYDLSHAGNIKYSFIAVSKNNDGQYILNSASQVSVGDKFTFIANYENPNSNEDIFTQREFVVLKDLDKESFVMEYGYAIFDQNNPQAGAEEEVYFDEQFDSNKITLVPEYTKNLDNEGKIGYYADFKNAIISIFVPIDNELLNYKVESSVENVCNFTYQTVKVAGGVNYVIDLSTKSTDVQDFVIQFSLFYDGFESSSNQNVCASIEIPVSIKSKPNQIWISSSNFSNILVDSKTFVFYNHYFSNDLGWQRFYFAVSPIGCNFSSLQIVLPEGCGLQVRYNGVVYHSGDTVVVSNLKNYVEFKGEEGATVSENSALQIKVLYDILIEGEELISNFNYKILEGPTNIDFENQNFKTKNIGLTLSSDGEIIDFSNQIYTDALFEDFNVVLSSGYNIVEFVKYEEVCQKIGEKYYLNFGFKTLSTGISIYSITLPNGSAISVSVEVVDALNYPSISTTNKNANMEMVDFNETSATIYARYNSENVGSNNSFDLNILSNGTNNSNAINDLEININDNSIISISNQNGFEFDVVLAKTGTTKLVLNVIGKRVDDFVISNYEIQFTIDIVVYEYIKELNVFKLRDGQNESYSSGTSARYVYVYDSNANSISKRQAQLEIIASQYSESVAPYLFKNPATGEFEYSSFNSSYIYWTVPGGYNVYLNDMLVSDGRMYIQGEGQSLYQIADSSGIVIANFDASSLTLTLTKDAYANFILVANIEQFGISARSYTVNVSILKYDIVESLSPLTPVSYLSFSTMDTTQEFNFRVLQNSAINKNVKINLIGDSFVTNNKTYRIFGEKQADGSYENIDVEINGSVVNIVMTLNEDFLNASANLKEFNPVLTIAAEDWYDDTGYLLDQYSGKVITLNIIFENGTEYNPFILDSTEDILKISDNLNAHYQVITTIDVSSITNELPLGEFNGTISGTKSYSKIVGINVSSMEVAENYVYAGLFSKLGKNAVIENLIFEGSFNLAINADTNAYIGIVAGENYGTLKNVSVNINSSNITLQGSSVSSGEQATSNNAYIGGLVGKNSGKIIQDFTEIDENIYKLYDYMLFMNDFLNISYQYFNTYAGGITGYSEGSIKKIDGKTIYGYSNYMAYSLIRTQLLPLEDGETDSVSKDYVGAIAGYVITNNDNVFVAYQSSENTYTTTSYFAGKGILVGGEVEGMSYVGGVAGKVEVGANSSFLGISSRTFVRALSESSNAGLISGNISTSNNSVVEPIFFMQAVDDGKTSENSSMLVINSATVNSIFGATGKQGTILNRLAFGVQGVLVETFKVGKDENYFITYLSREVVKIGEDNQPITITPNNSSIYYGEAVVVNQGTIVEQYIFANKGQTEDLSVTGNIKDAEGNIINALSSQNGNLAFYAYFFNALSSSSESEVGLAQAQELLNENYNSLNVGDELYPFVTQSDLLLKSQNTDILKIDANGKITIKGTGWARIVGDSLLNVNQGISFYIYVTNYFNPDKNISIVYSDLSTSSTPLNQATIYMFANDTAVLYVRPNYKFESKDNGTGQTFIVDSFGNAVINNYQFNLDQNSSITADVEINEEQFVKSISGQTVIITKKQTDANNSQYNLKITPILKSSYNGTEYKVEVNKMLTSVNVSYSKGAESIGLSTYDNLTISTTTEASETIIMRSSADATVEGVNYYITYNNQIIQEADSEDELFNISISLNENYDSNELIREYKYSLKISVNKESEAYKNRFQNNIYGQYKIVFIAKTNSAVYTTMNLNLENLPLQNIVIDNYNGFADMKENIGNSSEFAYPGSSSLLAVTLSPEDSDFDYIVIENDEQNYQSGNGNAVFELAARKENVESGKTLFESGVISGSATSKGLLITKDEVLKVYNDSTSYKDYSGVVYFKYEIGNSGIVDGSVSRFIIRVYKDGNVVKSSSIDLTLKLKESVSLSIDGKDKEIGFEYDTYRVARGLRYKINVNSYGFSDDNIELIVKDNQNLVTLEKVDGEYYIQIDNRNIVSSSIASIEVHASRMDGENEITADNVIDLIIMNYVVNSNLTTDENPDIVNGMDDGVITMPIGTSKSIKVDIKDYIEYDSSNQSVVDLVESFVESLNQNGNWKYTSNIKPGQTVPEAGAGEAKYSYTLNSGESNYYFNYDNFAFVPVRINDPQANLYYITYQGYYELNEDNTGYVAVDNKEGANTFATEIRFDVYVSSSEETPIPIFNYQDFLNMKVDGYYILLNDIVLPSKEYVENSDEVNDQYMPMVGNFASLDGNGHSIVLDGTYNFGSSSDLAIFSSLASESIIKNLNIKLLSSYQTSSAEFGVIFKTTNANNRVGILVASNSGIITNCKISTPTNTFFTIESPLAGIEATYFGGLVGENNGYITNCSTSINVTGSFNIAGLVGVNSGKIAASYFEDGILLSSGNQLGESYHVAGLVNKNLENGQIITSYVTSGISSQSLYSQNKESYLSSPNYSAGFVYDNDGLIQDCYSDIYLAKNANMAGFAYINTNTIKNCFSLSVLQNNTIAAAGFAMRNNAIDDADENQGDNSGEGVFENCYYLSDEEENINIDLNTVVFEGVEKLSVDDFANLENFEAYAYSNVVSTGAVWFFSTSGENNSNYVKFSATSEIDSVDNDNGLGVQYNTVYEKEYKTLPKGRLELSAPNIDVLSVRNFINAEENVENGDIVYNYQDDTSTDATSFATRGSIYNPYLIYDAQTMESLILENSNSSSNLNSENYRLISDIDYNSYTQNSQIYNTVYTGIFEGNGMEISAIVLQSNSNLENAGLFAQLGISSAKYGVIKNLTLSPASVTFPNVSSVGGVVGYVNYGQLYNINVLTDTDVAVTGTNFVGGIAGRAQGQFIIKNIYSNISVVSNYSPTEDQTYKENSNNQAVSYAGGAFGYLGSGYANEIIVEEINTVRGDRVGLAVGGIGKGGNVNNIKVFPASDTQIKAYRYGGIAIGEVVGNLYNVVVYSNGNSFQKIFSIDQIPTAVGGIAGVISGGLIENAVMQQSFEIGAKKVGISSIYSTIENVGGIVGMATNAGATVSRLSKCVMDGEIISASRLGGAIGNVASAVRLDQIAIKSNLKVTGQREIAILGGIVGNVESNPTPNVEITNSYCQGDLTIDTQNALNKPKAYIGGLIGVNTSNVKLTNCYTSSKLSLILKDLNSIDSFKDFNGLTLPSETEAGSNVSFYNQREDEKNIVNVYYYGANGGSQLGIVNQFVSVSSNFAIAGADGVSEYCSINNYGTSSYQNSGTSAQISVDSLKNISFTDSNNIWTGVNPSPENLTPNSDFRILTFENNLYWI